MNKGDFSIIEKKEGLDEITFDMIVGGYSDNGGQMDDCSYCDTCHSKNNSNNDNKGKGVSMD